MTKRSPSKPSIAQLTPQDLAHVTGGEDKKKVDEKKPSSFELHFTVETCEFSKIA